MRTVTTIGIAIAAGAIAAPAAAASNASGSFGINAYVPEVCDIAADDFTLDASGTVSGSVQEFCNTSTGFQIVASHRPLTGSEEAAIHYGNSISALDGSGLASLAFRSGQRIETVPVLINAGALDAPLSVAFSLYAV